MIKIDIIVAQYLPEKTGWIFLFVVIVTESIILSRILKQINFDKKIWLVVAASNIVTTLAGVYWFHYYWPDGDSERILGWMRFYSYHGEVRYEMTYSLFAVSFFATVILESLINIFLLRKHLKYAVLRGTFWGNIVTYIIAIAYFVFYFRDKLL